MRPLALLTIGTVALTGLAVTGYAYESGAFQLTGPVCVTISMPSDTPYYVMPGANPTAVAVLSRMTPQGQQVCVIGTTQAVQTVAEKTGVVIVNKTAECQGNAPGAGWTCGPDGGWKAPGM